YPTGYIVAALLNYAVINSLGWRAMFSLSSFSALLIGLIGTSIKVSNSWRKILNERNNNGHNLIVEMRK
ncbi:1204_t:CDS:1, partial [Racocetra fulgida]